MTASGLPAFKPGDTASLTRTITQADVGAFASLSGDTNPVHLDPEHARRTRFGRPIAHGALLGGLISAAIGTRLPGEGAIYLSSSLRFRAPCFVGDTVTATVTVREVRADRPILTLDTRCTNERGETLVTGESVVLHEPVVFAIHNGPAGAKEDA